MNSELLDFTVMLGMCVGEGSPETSKSEAEASMGFLRLAEGAEEELGTGEEAGDRCPTLEVPLEPSLSEEGESGGAVISLDCAAAFRGDLLRSVTISACREETPSLFLTDLADMSEGTGTGEPPERVSDKSTTIISSLDVLVSGLCANGGDLRVVGGPEPVGG